MSNRHYITLQTWFSFLSIFISLNQSSFYKTSPHLNLKVYKLSANLLSIMPAEQGIRPSGVFSELEGSKNRRDLAPIEVVEWAGVA